MQNCVSAVLLAAGLGLSFPLLAQDDHKAEAWASACFACHGPDGRSDGGMPALAGQSADGIYRALIDFKSGKRAATVMHRHAQGYSDEQLRRIADVLGVASN